MASWRLWFQQSDGGKILIRREEKRTLGEMRNGDSDKSSAIMRLPR